jgi:multicomponent K+:H+ antiporter subunit D
MTTIAPHLTVAPVLLPLAAAALVLALGEGRRSAAAAVNVVATLASLAVAIALYLGVHAQGAPLAYEVYLPGNWPVPFGIVLVADGLSTMMVLLTAIVGAATLPFALARWQHAGVFFHALFQLQLAGLQGAFLTADLFNLFVFFEVTLAASYGLLLHGGGIARVRAGLHYVAVNLVASLLFLIGVAVLYGVTGTLAMADIATKLPRVPEEDVGLLHAGAALLGLAFLIKAAVWPLNSWLPPAYRAASAPSAALFAVLTKLGVYAVLRLWTLSFGAGGTAAPAFADVLVWAGMATLAIGSLGMLASQQLGRLAAFSVIVSSGTLIATIGFDSAALSGGALYYLASATLGGCALFLLAELLERARNVEVGPDRLDDGRDRLPAFGEPDPRRGINLDEDERALVGRVLPAGLAFLGTAFGVCALVVAGFPPASGFVGKLAMLSELAAVSSAAAWVLFALLLVSGLLAAISFIRVGVRHFWTALPGDPLRLRVVETVPIAALLALTVLMVVHGEGLLSRTRDVAAAVHAPGAYVGAVMNARTVRRQEAAQ